LLNAAIALGLVERNSGGQFSLGVHGAAFLGNPALTAMVKHHALLYADLSDPVALLRGGQQRTALAQYWPYACAESPETLRNEDIRDYTALMSSSQALIAEDILEAWPLTRHRCLLDVGGGDGAFVTAAAARFPSLRLMLFDLPAVGQLAAARVAAAGLSHRVSVSSGDFFKEPLPRGADIVTLVRVLHDHDDANLVALLRNIRQALPIDGILLIAEPMSGIADTAEIGDAYFGFYLLAMGSGRARSPEEIARLLRETGFDAGRELKTRRPMLTRAMICRPVE
jgi:demethylspheroidene O-methyltransferase